MLTNQVVLNIEHIPKLKLTCPSAPSRINQIASLLTLI